MRALWWVIIGVVCFFFPLILVLLITKILFDASWWWFGSVLILEIVAAVVIGSIVLYFKLRKRRKPEMAVGVEAARMRAVNERKFDEDNPDNFLVERPQIIRVGEEGMTPVPLLWLKGKGTETQQRLDALVSLMDSDSEISWFVDESDDGVLKGAALMAGVHEIKQETIIGQDEFGRPVTRIKTERMSTSQKKLAEEQKQAEELNAV